MFDRPKNLKYKVPRKFLLVEIKKKKLKVNYQ